MKSDRHFIRKYLSLRLRYKFVGFGLDKIAAFSSLLANLLFFLPMQLGGREGGFALAVGGLSLSGAYGVYAALITRVREMVWIVIGLALMKVGNFKQSKEKYSA